MPPSESQIIDRLQENVARVRDRMAAAAARAGREHGARLVAVTKYVEPEIARLLVTECGVTELAESRPQELWRKVEALEDISTIWRKSERAAGEPAEPHAVWHLVGHLQRNKVKRTLPLVGCIDSADSLRLLEEISREAVVQQLIADVLIEVNISGDPTKHGIQPGELEPLLEATAKLPRVFVLGLMAMASLGGGPEEARREFETLRQLKERFPEMYAPNIAFIELSMGMSGDFEIAIEEGATMVRVGSALFEGLV
jgi:pyridoxal phosphate enzyme (YggS family)